MDVLRKSKFELLRIIAISMIVLHHLSWYGVMNDGKGYLIWLNGSNFNKCLSCMMDGGGEVGVGLFFMLTGYFLKKNSVGKKIISIILQCFYYAFVALFICVIAYACGYRFDEIGMSGLLKGIVRILFIPATGGCWWFVAAYVFLLALSPKINDVFNRYTLNGKLKIVFGIWFFWYIVGSFGSPFFILYKAIFFYLIGSCLSDTLPVDVLSKMPRKKILCFFGFVFFYTGYVFLDYIGINFSLSNMQMKAQLIEKIQSSIFVPLSCVFLFCFFILLRDFSNIFINTISSFTFGVYLLHGASILNFFIWKNVFKIASFYNQNFFGLYSLLCLVVLFVLTMILEIPRQRIQPKTLNFVIRKITFFNEKNYRREK